MNIVDYISRNFIRVVDYNKRIGIIIEVKYAENNRLDVQCGKALAQIEMKLYEQALWR